jgi:ribosomal RNA-processing protein 17
MPPADRKRKIHKTNAKAVDSISFDFDSRQEYLTGFHKRKVQRAEHGRELAQRKEKEAVVQARKEVCITISPKIILRSTEQYMLT